MRRPEAEKLFRALVWGAVLGWLNATAVLLVLYGLTMVGTSLVFDLPMPDGPSRVLVASAVLGLWGFYGGLRATFFRLTEDRDDDTR